MHRVVDSDQGACLCCIPSQARMEQVVSVLHISLRYKAMAVFGPAMLFIRLVDPLCWEPSSEVLLLHVKEGEIKLFSFLAHQLTAFLA